MTKIFFFFSIFIFFFQKIFSIENYTYPNYPFEYTDDSDIHPYYLRNITMLTVILYDDSNCFLQNSRVCVPVGECKEVPEEESLSYQIWTFGFDEEGNNPYIWIDFFDYNGICNYNDTEELIIGNTTYYGGYLDDYDTVQLGRCAASTHLFEGYYMRYYFGCVGDDKDALKEFVDENMDRITLGLYIFLPLILFMILFCIAMCLTQIFWSLFVDFWQIIKMGFIKCCFKEDYDRMKKEELKEIQELEIRELNKNKTMTEEELDEWKKKKLKKKFKEKFVLTQFKGRGSVKPVHYIPPLKEKKGLFKRFLKASFDCSVSILLVILLELKNVFALWYSMICFLRVDTDISDPFFIQNEQVHSNYRTILLIVALVYLGIEILLLIYWLGRHLLNPMKVIIIIGAYQEWLYFRILISSVYIFYAYFGAHAFTNTNSDFIAEYGAQIRSAASNRDATIFLSSSFWSILFFYFKFISSEIILVLDILVSLNFDGASSINYVHRIKEYKFSFPKINIGIPALFKSPSETLSQFLLILALIQTHDEKDVDEIDEVDEENIKAGIKRLSTSIDYGHLRWSMIKKLTIKEIKFMKETFFFLDQDELKNIQTREEEEFLDIFLYGPPLKIWWWKTLLCFSCYKTKQISEKKKKKKANLKKDLQKRNKKLRRRLLVLRGNNRDLEENLLNQENKALEAVLKLAEKKIETDGGKKISTLEKKRKDEDEKERNKLAADFKKYSKNRKMVTPSYYDNLEKKSGLFDSVCDNDDEEEAMKLATREPKVKKELNFEQVVVNVEVEEKYVEKKSEEIVSPYVGIVLPTEQPEEVKVGGYTPKPEIIMEDNVTIVDKEEIVVVSAPPIKEEIVVVDPWKTEMSEEELNEIKKKSENEEDVNDLLQEVEELEKMI